MATLLEGAGLALALVLVKCYYNKMVLLPFYLFITSLIEPEATNHQRKKNYFLNAIFDSIVTNTTFFLMVDTELVDPRYYVLFLFFSQKFQTIFSCFIDWFKSKGSVLSCVCDEMIWLIFLKAFKVGSNFFFPSEWICDFWREQKRTSFTSSGIL